MNSGEQRNNPFTPLAVAISDTFLQIRVKPLIFLTVWSLLALPPQLLPMLDIISPQPITETVENFYQNFGEMSDSDSQIAEQNSGVMKNDPRASLGLMVFIALAIQIYLYSVLGDVLASFRKKLPPRIAQSLTGGLKKYVGLLKVVLASGVRIVAGPLAIMLLGGVIGTLLDQDILTYSVFAVSLILLLMNQLRYGLAPFIHLALGITWRPALAASKSYYLVHHQVVLILFGFAIFLPLVFFRLLTNPLLKLGVFTGAVGIALGVLQSIASFFMSGVLINFGMNNFIPGRSDGEIE